jgi:hypothetical protein
MPHLPHFCYGPVSTRILGILPDIVRRIFLVMFPFSNERFFEQSKAVPVHAMKAPREEEVQLLLILNLGTRWG